mgnify:CR=1 FL=1|jgi:hypothetical protein
MGVKALITGKFINLEDLDLGDNGITVEGVKSLKLFSSV